MVRRTVSEKDAASSSHIGFGMKVTAVTLAAALFLLLVLLIFDVEVKWVPWVSFVYVYMALIAAASILGILVILRLIEHPEPRSRYSFPKFADWWPVPHFLLAVVYLGLLVNAFAVGYWLIAKTDSCALKLPPHETVDYLNALYFSVTTFTTTGYGDITPGTALRLPAALEMLTGYTIFGIFVASCYQMLIRPTDQYKAKARASPTETTQADASGIATPGVDEHADVPGEPQG
jgi:hypothetical protein